MMKHKIVKMVALALVGASLLSSCGGGTVGPSSGEDVSGALEVQSSEMTGDNAGTASVDTISSASTSYYYEDSALTQEEFIADLRAEGSNRGSATIATVNPDGSPNIAVAIPGAADDNTVMFGISPNQTSANFKTQKMAVLAYYIYDPSATEKTERNIGCRVILELIEDGEKIAELNEGKENTDSIYYFRIVKVIPLG